VFESVQRGMYEVGGKEMYFRSRWEYLYAEYLEFLRKNGEIQQWYYEPHFFDFPIKHGTTRYLPDFAVVENSGEKVYHEVKGYMSAKDKTKLKRMAKYYPNVKLVLIQRAFIKSIEWVAKSKLTAKK
jgi:Protein of unknown function (DUF1064)